MKKLLITGFAPFDKMSTNPSQEVIDLLPENPKLKKIILPVSFKNAFQELKKEIDHFRPEIIVLLGLASNRKLVSLERIAINIQDARIADNDNYQPKNLKININGHDGLFSTLPIQELLEKCQDNKMPVEISNTAGTYVCNDLMYKTLDYTMAKDYKAGFIHIPPTPHMNLEEEGLELTSIINCISYIAKYLQET